MITRVTVNIAAPVERVWFALTEVDAVAAWAGITPIAIPAGYPAAGQTATWWDRGVILRDDILAAVPNRQLLSRLRRGPAIVVEDYQLRARGPRTTELAATWRGHPALAASPVYPTRA